MEGVSSNLLSFKITWVNVEFYNNFPNQELQNRIVL